MSFYNENDIRLDEILRHIKEDMEKALELINECNKDDNSEFNTYDLEKSIRRFLEDW